MKKSLILGVCALVFAGCYDKMGVGESYQYYENGVSDYEMGYYEKAANNFRTACSREHALACERVAQMHESGILTDNEKTERNEELAEYFYGKACFYGLEKYCPPK